MISPKDLEVLDRYEGYPTLYYRQEIKVDARGTGEQVVMSYMMHQTYKISLPRAGYYDIIVEGYSNWGLPVEQLDKTIDLEEIK